MSCRRRPRSPRYGRGEGPGRCWRRGRGCALQKARPFGWRGCRSISRAAEHETAACLERPGRSCSGFGLVYDAVKFPAVPYLTELSVLSQVKAFHFTCCCALNEILCKQNLKSCYFLFILTKPKMYCHISNFVPLNFCSLGHQRNKCIPIPASAGVH